MQTSAGRNQTGSAASDLAQRPVTGIARGATLIGGLTILSRSFGLIPTLVFSQTVGRVVWAPRMSPRTRGPTLSTSWSWAPR